MPNNDPFPRARARNVIAVFGKRRKRQSVSYALPGSTIMRALVHQIRPMHHAQSKSHLKDTAGVS